MVGYFDVQAQRAGQSVKEGEGKLSFESPVRSPALVLEPESQIDRRRRVLHAFERPTHDSFVSISMRK